MASAGYTSSSGGASTRSASYAEDRADPRRQPIPMVKGKPMWAANRQHTAQENAEYQFEHDGPDFGATSVDDFVTKVHAFVDKPPQDVMTLTRANGDRLLYDTHSNVFAVVTKDGAPRTMFKPRTGEAYWEEQKAREAAQAERADAGGGRGYYRGKSSGASGSDDQG
jgi:pyocin large subunit-like protein